MCGLKLISCTFIQLKCGIGIRSGGEIPTENQLGVDQGSRTGCCRVQPEHEERLVGVDLQLMCEH